MTSQRAQGDGDQVPVGPRGLKGVRLGRVAGVEVGLDWSLLIVFGLIAMALAGGVLPRWHPDWGQAKVLTTALAAAVLFLASVLVHELAHAVVGRRHGVEIRRITLFVFGGMAHLEEEPKDWQAELRMAIAGPLASLGLGFLFLILAQAIAGPIAVDPQDPARALAQVGPVATLLLWLGPVNIILGLFNLVPGFPLDGGRVLRAILWGLTGDLTRSTLMAAMAGQVVSWVLIGLGFAMILGLRVPVFGSGALGGFWLALIGWFLGNAARQSWQGRLMEDRLGALPVARVMHHDYRRVDPDLSVQELVDQGFLALSYRAYPVVEADQLQGLVSLEDVRRLDRRRWAELRVADVMIPLDRLHILRPGDSAVAALRLLAEQGVNQLPVVDKGRLLGLVTREDILRWVALGP
ncbi:MAG: site-2 protease family protein [Bdellovibrio bacteriovorus]